MTIVAVSAALLLPACAAEDAQFTVRHAKSLPAAGSTVSVFGVYKDGVLSTHYWDVLSTDLSGAFGQEVCDVGFGEHLERDAPELAKKLDEITREDGISPEVIAQVAPRATGDLILAVDVFGRLATAGRTKPAKPGAPAPGAMAAGGRGAGRRGGPQPVRSSRTEVEESALEMTASFYSAKTREVLAKVAMRYHGTSGDEAIKIFAAKLKSVLPEAKCAAWTWQAP